MTASDLQDLLIARLVRSSGGTARRWRMAIGPVRVRSADSYTHCNWEVDPSGTPPEVAAIERLLDTVRLERPFVTT
ncbi:hypothetical protein ACFOKI_04940 [Sphingomonas qilianensis]|uniref:Uncharacterized protein n=1 Tax=Sphingomonas qilianensis TaxID=1736690 RepID=A0ABU9XUK4_9SPHN